MVVHSGMGRSRTSDGSCWYLLMVDTERQKRRCNWPSYIYFVTLISCKMRAKKKIHLVRMLPKHKIRFMKTSGGEVDYCLKHVAALVYPACQPPADSGAVRMF